LVNDVYYRGEGVIPVVLGHGSTGSSGQWRQLKKRGLADDPGGTGRH
jgi:hypothetical protein